MNNLNDNQKNMLIVGVGVLIAIILFIMRYLDLGEIEKLTVEKAGIDGQIRQLKNQELKIEDGKKDLFLMRANIDSVKKLLPEEKQVTEFMELLEKFRLDNGMQPFTHLKKVDPFFDIFGEGEVVPATNSFRPTATTENPFEEDAYLAEFKGNFDQIGELISKVESYERFFSVKDIIVDFTGLLKDENIGKKITGGVKLLLTTFTFNNPDPTIDEQVKQLLENYEASPLLEQEVKKRRDELLARPVFDWVIRDTIEDPFYPFRAINRVEEKPTIKPDTEENPITPVDVSMEERYDILNELYNNDLYPKALSGLWLELESRLKATKFEKNIKELKLDVFSEDFDPDGSKKAKVKKMASDLEEWNNYIREQIENLRIQLVIDQTTESLKEIEKLYKKGKEDGSEKLLKEVVTKHDEVLPELKRYQSKEKEFPAIETLRNKMEFFYKKATTQLRIMDLRKELELTGIIYQRNRKDQSIAFINNKPVTRNKTLKSGFKIQEIHNGWVVLSYEGETVPLRMKSINDK